MAVLSIVAVNWYRETMEMPWSLIAPNHQVVVATRMAELGKKGQYDEAIDVGVHSTNGRPEDAFIYQMVAETYFVRALHDKNQSGKWTKLGAQYSQKALDSDPNDIANVFNVGLNYVVAGDDLDTGGCEYYRKAKDVFDSLVPRLQGDRAETQGRTIRLAPLRRRNEKERVRVEESLRRCPGPAG